MTLNLDDITVQTFELGPVLEPDLDDDAATSTKKCKKVLVRPSETACTMQIMGCAGSL